MSQVVSGTLERVKDLLPNQIGTNRRWSDDAVERHIMLADGLIRERLENLYHQQEISVVSTTNTFVLDEEFIDITSVEFSYDGSTYDWFLKPATLDDLDKINLKWRDDTGTRPEYYVLLGAPGTGYSKIMTYRQMSSQTTETIRVTGLGVGESTTTIQDDIISKCHVPHVMSVLLAKDDPNAAAEWHAQYLNGCDEIRRRTKSKYSRGTTRTGVGY